MNCGKQFLLWFVTFVALKYDQNTLLLSKKKIHVNVSDNVILPINTDVERKETGWRLGSPNEIGQDSNKIRDKAM